MCGGLEMCGVLTLGRCVLNPFSRGEECVHNTMTVCACTYMWMELVIGFSSNVCSRIPGNCVLYCGVELCGLIY